MQSLKTVTPATKCRPKGETTFRLKISDPVPFIINHLFDYYFYQHFLFIIIVISMISIIIRSIPIHHQPSLKDQILNTQLSPNTKYWSQIPNTQLQMPKNGSQIPKVHIYTCPMFGLKFSKCTDTFHSQSTIIERPTLSQ